jgi:hypothetical protein
MNRTCIFSILLVGVFLTLSSSCKKDKTGDGTVPVIMVLGQNPINWALDLPYVDAGAVAYDITPAGDTVDITNKISTSNNVNIAAIGDYEVKYNVTDDSGLSAVEKVRVVKVVFGKKK